MKINSLLGSCAILLAAIINTPKAEALQAGNFCEADIPSKCENWAAQPAHWGGTYANYEDCLFGEQLACDGDPVPPPGPHVYCPYEGKCGRN